MAPSSQTSSSSKPLLAAIASAIVPGVGQLIVGDRRKGTILIGIDLAILVGLYLYMGDALTLAKLWLQPSQLAMMMIGNIVLLGYRIWAADDAYRTAKNKGSRNLSPSMGAMLGAGIGLAAVLVLPHVVFGYYDIVQYDLITTVFASSSPSPTQPGPESTTPPATTATGDTVETPTSTTTQPPAANFWESHDRLNILLIGGDFGVGRKGIRTDTMITISIDPVSGDTAMFSVPRNWTQSPLPEGMGVWDCNCYPELINELWVAGEQYPDAFPGPSDNPSVNAVKGVISEFLGIPIHYYAMVNLDGFVEIVDALGGVEVYVPDAVYDAKYPSEDGVNTEVIDIKPGMNKFDGHLALAYSRSRNQDSDYFRMNRQRCVIEAMAEQIDPINVLRNFQALASVIKDTMLTDIPIEALPQLVDLKPVIDLDNLVSVRFIPPEYSLGYRDDGKPGQVPNIELVHEHVALVIADPARAVQELGLEQLDDVCGDPNA
ncbi:MAG: LCP family protein [Acidimicrobiia bacterium]|nr:LCP family protein [Acidimicrobiia bacterium]